MPKLDQFPIAVVAHRTGLTPHVIRAWEKRYQAVTPCRSKTNRRSYTEADIQRLTLLRQATAMGYNIGQIARLPNEELAQLIAPDLSAKAPPSRTSFGPSSTAAEPATILQHCWAAIEAMDQQRLEEILSAALVQVSLPVLLTDVIVALMEQVGERWERGTLRIAAEHVAATAVCAFLMNRLNARRRCAFGPCLVVTTPSGELHEVGALLAAVVAADSGWRATYLGPSLPAEEIALAARCTQAEAVALSVVYPPNHPAVMQELESLRRCLASPIHLLVGGRAAASYAPVLQEIGAVLISDLSQWRHELDRLLLVRSVQKSTSS